MLTRVKLVLLLIILMIVSSACNVLNEETKSDKQQIRFQRSYSKDDIMDMGPVRGGTLRLFSTIPDTLNPLMTNNIFVKDFSELIFDSLVKLDEKQQAIPMLSDQWSVSEDGLTWTFHIRSGVQWHDNMPLSAEDVEFTFKTILNPAVHSIYMKNLQNITTFAAVDRNNFRIILKTPFSFTAELMTFPIIPRHYFEGEDIVKSSRNMAPVGTGLYKLSSYSDKREVLLTINDRWWKTKLEKTGPQNGPFITEVLVKIYEDGRDAINAFQTRDVDMAFVETGSLNRYNGRSDMILKKFPGKDFDFIALNLSKPVFQDRVVRQALALAIDKSEIINNLLPGEAIAADIPVIPNSWFFGGNQANFTSDPVKAKEILSAAGWKDNNGVLYKNLNGIYTQLDLELLVNDDNELRYKVAGIISEQLRKTGINLHVKRLQWDEQFNLINTRKFDMALLGYKVASVPDLSFAYSSSGILSGTNASGYSNPVIDNFLGQLLVSNNNEEKISTFTKLRDVLSEDVPSIGLYFHNNGVLYSRKIKGNFTPYTWNKFNGITQWYIPVK